MAPGYEGSRTQKKGTAMARKTKGAELEIRDAVKGAGIMFEIGKAIAHAVMAKGGNMQHLRRIVKEPALQRQIADLIVPATSLANDVSDRPLAENEYLVSVDYTMPRDKVTLEAEFSKDGVSDLFYGDFEWQPHSSDERIMLLKHFGRNTESEANIAEMDTLGYRPATHLEAYAFAKANPELQRQFWIVALGSSAMRGDLRAVAVLSSVSGRRVLGYVWFDREWRSGRRFLFVRKT